MKGHGGFTFVELVLTLVVLGIVSVAAGAKMMNLGAVQSDGAARRLVSDLAYARRLAQNRSALYGVTFNAANDTYTVHLYADGVETAVEDPLTHMPMIVDYRTSSSLEGTDLQNPSFDGGVTVRFMPRGTPLDAAGNTLANTGSVVLTRGGVPHTVYVQPNTGEVSYQ